MAYQDRPGEDNMQESFRPSKQFLIRGAIATGIIAIILIVQTDWFRALLHKDPLPDIVPAETVGDLLSKDSNGNGIADWEEKLWGLDPSVLYTNGVPNKTLIEQKKLALGVSNESNVPEDETDALARELITIATALGQEGQSDATLAAIATKMADSVEINVASNYYGLKDLRTTTTTSASLRAYYASFQSTTTKYDTGAPEIDILVEGFESGDMSRVQELLATKVVYDKYAKALLTITVPIGIEREHLEIINSIHAMGLSFGYLAQVEGNAVHALAGIALYRLNDQRLALAAEAIIDYLVRYGILQRQQ